MSVSKTTILKHYPLRLRIQTSTFSNQSKIKEYNQGAIRFIPPRDRIKEERQRMPGRTSSPATEEETAVLHRNKKNHSAS
jgi:hypothetical protein